MLGFVFRNRVRLRAVYGPPPGAAAPVPPSASRAHDEPPAAPRSQDGTLRRRTGVVLLKPQRRRA